MKLSRAKDAKGPMLILFTKDFQRIQIQQKSKADISQEDIERIFFLMPFD